LAIWSDSRVRSLEIDFDKKLTSLKDSKELFCVEVALGLGFAEHFKLSHDCKVTLIIVLRFLYSKIDDFLIVGHKCSSVM